MGGTVQFSDITHLRYWSGAGHNKEVRDRLGLISPPIARAQRGEVHDHDYKDVARKHLSHLAYPTYRSGDVIIASDKKTKLYSDVTCIAHPVAGDLATGAKAEMVNLQDIFKDIKDPVLKVLGYFHERALDINAGLASDIARLAFIIKLRREGKSSAYADWDAGQDLYDLTETKNIEQLHHKWNKNTGHQEASAVMRQVNKDIVSNDVMLSIHSDHVEDKAFMMCMDHILERLAFYFVASGKKGVPDFKTADAIDERTYRFINDNIEAPEFDKKFFKFMISEISLHYKGSKKEKKNIIDQLLKNVFGIKKKGTEIKPHSLPHSLIASARNEYEISRRAAKDHDTDQNSFHRRLKAKRRMQYYVTHIAGPDAIYAALGVSPFIRYVPQNSFFGPNAGVKNDQHNDRSWLSGSLDEEKR